MAVAHYTFVPWLRRGLGVGIHVVDDLGTETSTTPGRIALPVEVSVEYLPVDAATPATAPAVNRTVALLGPGDVIGLDRGAIIRTEPANGAHAVPATHLAYIELYEEDLPWRYTPAAAADATAPAEQRHKLRPWLALWVLAAGEFELMPERVGRPQSIRLTPTAAARALPRHDEIWAWAHVQVSRALTDVTEVAEAIDTAPDHALSRIVCPRRLQPDVEYHAFLVPVFEAGRLAGLGENPSNIPAQAPSWRAGAMPHSTVRTLEHPTYHHWSFRTGRLGDFEALVRALVPGPVGERFGRRPLDVAAPGFGLDGAGTTVQVEGALAPPDMPRDPFPTSPGDPFVVRLEGVLDLSAKLERGSASGVPHPYHRPGDGGAYAAEVPDDPIVTPPSYGRHHARTDHRSDPDRLPALADIRDDDVLAWFRELNLDPRSRVAAGLGASVVQERQEELVQRAWEQVGKLAVANRALRRAELALVVSEALFAKHVVHPDEERTLRLTAAAQRRVLNTTGATIAADVAKSRVPLAATTPAFKRLTRPQLKSIRRHAGSGSVDGLHRELVARFNRDVAPLSAAPPPPPLAVELALADVRAAVEASITEYETDGARPGHIFLELVAEDLRTRLAADPAADLSTLAIPTLRTSLRGRLDARLAPTSPPQDLAIRATISGLIDDIAQLVHEVSRAILDLFVAAARFANVYGTSIAGKSFGGVTIRPLGGALGDVAKMTVAGELGAFSSALAGFGELVADARTDAPPPPPLATVAALVSRTLTELQPRRALARRITGSIRGLGAPTDPARPLRPVMAYPDFPDPMFEDLRRFGDFVIPNYDNLPPNTITILSPNRRFIESYMAGLNDELGRELLWREYPTDQRGSYFMKFWDTRDAAGDSATDDITAMHTWSGLLGAQTPAAPNYLVLVVRGELFRRYPSAVVYAQRAAFGAGGHATARDLAPETVPANVLFPSFRGRLEPDITLIGFALGIDQARGHRPVPGDPRPPDPGWFIVLKERPGEVAFGLDDGGPSAPPLDSWNDLTWSHLVFPPEAPESITLGANTPVVSPGGDPSLPRAATWGHTAADLAYILLQNPVLYARHAEELLP